MKQILIVDDEILIADTLQEMLARATAGRARVQVCYSGAEALGIMRAQPVDVLMTDINMPDCSGLQLHSRVMALQPDCRVIYLTGYSEFEYARQALDQRAFAYVLKGEGDDMILRTVNRALGDEPDASPAEDPPAPQESAGMPWIPELMGYIEAHIAQDLSLQQLAETMHFHPVYLARAFKEATGTTVGEYIATVRLERAKALLSGSRLPLQEVALRTGFTSTNYFCRWFNKEMHMTPKTYRNRKGRPS